MALEGDGLNWDAPNWNVFIHQIIVLPEKGSFKEHPLMEKIDDL